MVNGPTNPRAGAAGFRVGFSTHKNNKYNSNNKYNTSLQQQREQEGLSIPQDATLLAMSRGVAVASHYGKPARITTSGTHRQQQQQQAQQQQAQQQQQANNQQFLKWQQIQTAALQRWQELQQLPAGSFGPDEWRDSIQLLHHWYESSGVERSTITKANKNAATAAATGKQPYKQQPYQQQPVTFKLSLEDHALHVKSSMELLERLLHEKKALEDCNEDHPHVRQCKNLSNLLLVRTKWLDKMTRNWQFLCKRRQAQQPSQTQPQQQSPSNHDTQKLEIMNHYQFLDKIQALSDMSQGLLAMNAHVYAMIMNVMARRTVFGASANHLQQRKQRQQYQQQPPDATAAWQQEMTANIKDMESILDHMEQRNIPPDIVNYTTILQAWEYLGDGPRAIACLERLCHAYHNQQQQSSLSSSSLQPTRECFQSVLNALVRGPKSAQTTSQCRDIIRQMQHYHKTHGLDTAPGIRAYNTLLQSLMYHYDAPQQESHYNVADDDMVLEEARRIFDHEIPRDMRDKQSYHFLLELYSRRGMSLEATELLQEMYDEYLKTGDKRIAPYTKSFNLVLAALGKAGDHGGVERHFRLMEELATTGGMLRDAAPDRYTYTILLESWARQVGHIPDAADRCDHILHTMKRLANDSSMGKESVRPTTVTYSIVMKAHAKVGNARRAEELLGEIMDAYVHSENPEIRPDVTAFNTALLALSRSNDDDAVQRIQSMIQRMEDITNKGVLGKNICLQPNVASYNCLLQAIARSRRRGAGEECERLITEKMIPNPHLTPDIVSWTSLVSAYANAGKAEHAERILDKVCERYYLQDFHQHDGGVTKSRPTVQLVSAVMTAWAKSGAAEAPERAERLIKRMHELSLAGELSGSMDVVCYNALLDVWSKSGRPDAGRRCLEILKDMEEEDITPNTISFNTTLNALAEQGDIESCEVVFERMNETPSARPGHDTLSTLVKAWSNTPSIKADDERAEVVLKKVLELQKSTGIVPNVACYNIVLDCLAKTECITSCQVAEDLLLEMERLAHNESEKLPNGASIRPDLVSYTTVIQAYAKLGEAHKAELMLERLVQEYVKRGNKGGCLKPSTMTFNSALRAWAQHAKKTPTSSEAPLRCEALLERMKRLHATSSAPVKPDVQSYNHLLNCWGNSGVHESATRALAILEEMTASGDSDISPDTVSYNTVIAAISRTGDFKKAESLLESMYHKYRHMQSLGVPSLAKPNLISWNSLMAAYTKSKSQEALGRAEAAIEKMKTLYKSGELEAKPNTTSFNCLLQCLARSAEPSDDSAQRCDAIFRDLMSQSESGDPTLTPDAHSYAAVIRAWRNGGNWDRVFSLMVELCKDVGVKPDVEMFRYLLRTLRESSSAERVNVEETVLRRMRDLHPHLADIRHDPNYATDDATAS